LAEDSFSNGLLDAIDKAKEEAGVN
jgi:hypothetical protein